MEENLNLLESRILDTLDKTDLESIRKKLESINEPTICIGSGGSKVVADFASKVLNQKNGIATKVMEPRDALYENINGYKALLLASYGARNYGVEVLKPLNIEKYLLTYGNDHTEYNMIKCISSIKVEKSFISLAGTLMPMSILLASYLEENPRDLIREMFKNVRRTYTGFDKYPFEIMSGNDTSTPSLFLETTFTESALAYTLVHHKYDYCHGRSTLAKNYQGNMIYLKRSDTDLDRLLIELLSDVYDRMIILSSNYKDIIIDNYFLTLSSVYLASSIAKERNIDLSHVDYRKEIVKCVYRFNKSM